MHLATKVDEESSCRKGHSLHEGQPEDTPHFTYGFHLKSALNVEKHKEGAPGHRRRPSTERTWTTTSVPCVFTYMAEREDFYGHVAMRNIMMGNHHSTLCLWPT